MSSSTLRAALEELITCYNDLNSSRLDELTEEPSPLEFMRYVARNTPFVVRGAAQTWKCYERWDSTYLNSIFSGQIVNIAITPNGFADAPTFSADHGEVVFAKPLEQSYPFNEFLKYIMEQETLSSKATTEVRYAQTRMSSIIYHRF